MPMYDHITPGQKALIHDAQMFFIASVSPDLTGGPDGEGPVNVSPKGGVPLHVLDTHHVAYLDYPGSGNETHRHAGEGGPCTVMIMSTSAEDAAIVRLYGHATVTPIDESPLAERLLAESADYLKKPRQIIEITVESTQTSCGYGVPVYEYVGQRSNAGRGRKYKEARIAAT